MIAASKEGDARRKVTMEYEASRTGHEALQEVHRIRSDSVCQTFKSRRTTELLALRQLKFTALGALRRRPVSWLG
jgi:hypothetical protein